MILQFVFLSGGKTFKDFRCRGVNVVLHECFYFQMLFSRDFLRNDLARSLRRYEQLMTRNGGHQAVRRAGSCFLDNSVHYTDQWFSLANTKWLFIFTSIAQR